MVLTSFIKQHCWRVHPSASQNTRIQPIVGFCFFINVAYKLAECKQRNKNTWERGNSCTSTSEGKFFIVLVISVSRGLFGTRG